MLFDSYTLRKYDNNDKYNYMNMIVIATIHVLVGMHKLK